MGEIIASAAKISLFLRSEEDTVSAAVGQKGDRMGISYENYSEGSGKIYSRAALFYFTDQCGDSIGVVFV